MGYGAQRNQQNDGIAHRWAHQLPNIKKRGDDAGTLFEMNKGGNFYRDELVIFSYGDHFPIAALHKKPKAKDYTVFFTLREYSPTTSAHKWTVKSAVSHLKVIYCFDPKLASQGMHSENLQYWEKKAKEQYDKIATAKKPENYFGAIARYREELKAYCKYFGLTKSKSPILKSFKCVWLKPSKKVVEQAKAREKKEAEARKKAEATKAEKERQLQVTAEKIKPLILEAWHNFKPYIGQGLPLEGLEKGVEKKLDRHLSHRYTGNNTLLRANMDTKIIETSQGIDIPFEVAHRFYKWLKQQLKNGGCNGDCKHEILGYEVRTVNHDGFIVGCHNVLWTETEAIARKLNW